MEVRDTETGGGGVQRGWENFVQTEDPDFSFILSHAEFEKVVFQLRSSGKSWDTSLS